MSLALVSSYNYAMDVEKTMEFLLGQQARFDAQLQAIAQKQSRNEDLIHQNETLVHHLTLLMSQQADRQAKQFRQLTAAQKELADAQKELTAAQKKTDAQLQKLIRSMISANGRKRNA